MAVAASQGLITTRTGKDTFGTLWRATAEGVSLIMKDWTD